MAIIGRVLRLSIYQYSLLIIPDGGNGRSHTLLTLSSLHQGTMSNDGLQMMLPIRFINDLVFTSQAHLKHDHLADYRWNSGQVTTWCSHLKHDHLADNRWNSGQVMIDDRSSKRPRLTSDSDVQAEERRSMPALACCY